MTSPFKEKYNSFYPDAVYGTYLYYPLQQHCLCFYNNFDKHDIELEPDSGEINKVLNYVLANSLRQTSRRNRFAKTDHGSPWHQQLKQVVWTL